MGNDERQMREDGTGPMHALDLVIVASSHVIAKTYYEQPFVEGSNLPPDCFSNNGYAPDPMSTSKQNPLCATCRHNVIGSFVNPETGRKAKRCHDRKRMAVVPAADLHNERWGGPMLLTSPPTSLSVLLTFDLNMRQMGYPYYSYVTRIGFDADAAYPRFVLSAQRALTDEEAQVVDELRIDPRTERIIAEANNYTEDMDEIAPDGTVIPAKPAPRPQPKHEPKAAPAAQQSPMPPEQPAPTPAAAPAKKPRGRPAGSTKAAPKQIEMKIEQPATDPGVNEPPPDEPEEETAAPASAAERNLDDLLDNLLPQGNA
jgi:hypothetical protein